MKKEYKCKYCEAVFEKPLLMAQHVRTKHKKTKAREKAKLERVTLSEEISKAIEAIGILKGLQVSPKLSEGEKKILDEVSKRIEELVTYVKKSK